MLDLDVHDNGLFFYLFRGQDAGFDYRTDVYFLSLVHGQHSPRSHTSPPSESLNQQVQSNDQKLVG